MTRKKKKNENVEPTILPEIIIAPREAEPTLESAPQSPLPEPENEPRLERELETELEAEPEPEAPKQPPYVALIDDPFGIRTLEISEAQQSPDELDLDEELEEGALAAPADIEQSMEKIADAIASETRKQEEELAATAADQSAAELAAQIAEDKALEAAQKAEDEAARENDPELKAALPSLDLAEIQSCIEALLFMTDKPMSDAKLQEHLGPDFPMALFQEALTSLADRYQRPEHGIELAQIAGGWQFRTKPGRAALAKKLAKVQTQRLSSGAMETLAIVAYKQPVLKDDIDKIRGVDSSHFVRGLLDKKLIKIDGRSELPGRPMVYSTTQEFLELFGLKDLSAMPALHELESMIPSSQSGNPEEEDPRVREMRKLVSQMNADKSTSLVYDPREDESILKEIRERVAAIPSTTPYLEQQKEAEKQAAELAAQAALAAQQAVGELPLETTQEG